MDIGAFIIAFLKLLGGRAHRLVSDEAKVAFAISLFEGDVIELTKKL